MRTIRPCLALFIAAPAAAGSLFLDGSALVTDFHADFLGADAFPFAGLSDGDAVGFHFVFDADAAPVSDDGSTAVYQFGPNGSTMTLGAHLVALDTLTITVNAGPGLTQLEFAVANQSLGFSSSLLFLADEQLALTPPASLDPYAANGAFYANSDLNLVLLPVVMGEVTAAAITPAPGGMGLLGVGLLAAGRRARKR